MPPGGWFANSLKSMISLPAPQAAAGDVGQEIAMQALTTLAARRPRALMACLIGLALLGASVLGACGGGHPPAATPPAQASHDAMAGLAEARAAAWSARPAYTHVNAATEQAYRWAMHNPDVLQWIPCYCGCGGLGHESNLDCYYEPRSDGAIAFDEHASYCTICVDITLRVQQLEGTGASLVDIRTTIDIEFGDYPGTDTPWPPS
jgi:hypothetical protein